MQMRHLKTVLVAALASVGLGCGSLDFPLTLALDGDNDITIDVYVLGSPTGIVAGTSLEGGVDLTMSTTLADLFDPHGILAMVTVDDVLIAGPSFELLGQTTGTVCVNDVPDSGGGTALLRLFQGEAEFNVVLDTVIQTLGDLGSALPDGLPFSTALEASTPFTLGDLLDLVFGGGGGISVSQEISTTIMGPGDGSSILDLIDGSPITATLTLVSADAIPDSLLIDECVAALGH